MVSATDGDASRRKRVFLILSLILAVVILAGAYAAFSVMRSGNEGDAATKGRNAPRVTVLVASNRSVETILSATGSVAARREMPVGVVGEGGQVQRVLVEPGQWVKQGQVLAVIDRDVQSQQAEALSASIRVAQADAELAQAELARAEALVSRGFISKADLDRKRATRDAAQARVRVAQAQYRESLARNARLNIVAPAGGLVLTRDVEPGQIVGAGSGTLFRMARDGEMEMLARLSEADLQRVSVGTRATVTPVGTDLTITGQVWQISPVVDPQTRQGTVRISVPYHMLLRPGGFADARLIVGAGEAPMLPESAVQSSPDGSYVLIVDDKNIVRRRNVTVGTVTDQGVAIAGGLTGGEKVVILAGSFLNIGDTVKPVVQKVTP
ncbi:efflux RND transporter periplasmic adaptor subunit [Sphingopyxis yananensis]|uniref:efflux RND transporter periplasmic adaptor subunit n=1 Tax=Sphingopyxis yananensis TaxID=2886687 RepID=UPI002235214A